jgi:hypothetical protein
LDLDAAKGRHRKAAEGLADEKRAAVSAFPLSSPPPSLLPFLTMRMVLLIRRWGGVRQLEQDLQNKQEAFDKQYEVVKMLLENIQRSNVSRHQSGAAFRQGLA